LPQPRSRRSLCSPTRQPSCTPAPICSQRPDGAVWEPTPDSPALIIVIDEYAELADDAPDATRHTDSIARLDRAVAVTLIAATQRPTQKDMGQGAVRSQMDIRICFRVRERKDVDLVLGQGMLSVGWNAHALNAPGKFLVSAPEHTTPKRSRGNLVIDQAVSETAAKHADNRPELEAASRYAVGAAPHDDEHVDAADKSDPPAADLPESRTRDEATAAEDALSLALSMAPDGGCDIGELLDVTGMSRPILYRYLAQLAKSGRAVQVSRGRWSAARRRSRHRE
jgi:hypothetical protein